MSVIAGAAPAPEVFISFDRLARAEDARRPAGVIRRAPEDFVVDEVLGLELDGEGSHAWLQIEKRDVDTEMVARRLAEVAGVRQRDVGYSGLKDRRAVARQWFSVPVGGGEPDWAALEDDAVRVLVAMRHGRKLRRGTHRANRFTIRVTDLGVVDAGGLDDATARVGSAGVPNYFGPQRFGRGDSNLTLARRVVLDGQRERSAHLRGLALSSARSMLFNRVLDARTRDGTWERLLPGEVVSLDGSRSVFHAEQIDATLVDRALRHDVHPSGPLPGRGGRRPDGLAGEFEAAALAGCGPWEQGLERAGVEHARRSLRLPVRALTHQRSGETLELAFELPAGAYATAVLRELVDVTSFAA